LAGVVEVDETYMGGLEPEVSGGRAQGQEAHEPVAHVHPFAVEGEQAEAEADAEEGLPRCNGGRLPVQAAVEQVSKATSRP